MHVVHPSSSSQPRSTEQKIGGPEAHGFVCGSNREARCPGARIQPMLTFSQEGPYGEIGSVAWVAGHAFGCACAAATHADDDAATMDWSAAVVYRSSNGRTARRRRSALRWLTIIICQQCISHVEISSARAFFFLSLTKTAGNNTSTFFGS